MKLKSKIPNLLTYSRMVATLILGFQLATITRIAEALPILIGLTIFVYLSDILDGFLARKWKVATYFGAKADIFADLIYILSQCIILSIRGWMSFGIVILIICEFIVFAITNYSTSKAIGKKAIWFDRVGKTTAIYYYCMPIMFIILNSLNVSAFRENSIIVLNIISIVLTAFAVTNRLYMYHLTHRKVKINS